MAANWFSRESFSFVDTAWLQMEKPTNRAMITGIMTFNEVIDFERLKATLLNRLLCYRRFRQRVCHPWLRMRSPVWEIDPHFDLNTHLRRIALPSPGDRSALQNLVGDLMSTPLDFSRPLWQMHLVENYENGCALVSRLHHCIADGIALMQVLLSIADDQPDAPWPVQPDNQPERLIDILRLLQPAVHSTDTALHLTEEMLHEGMQSLIHPTRALNLAGSLTSGGLALAKLLLILPDRKTIFKGPCGITKRAAWSAPLPLETVKAVGKAMGATINDILLASVTGALRRYLEDRDEQTDGVEFRAVVPVSLRPPEDFNQLGNKFGLVFLKLPVGVIDPIKRLAILKHRMDAIKDTPEALVAFGILNAVGMSPVLVEDIIVQIFGAKGTAVMTNVPGPRQTLYLAGQAIHEVMFWVPQPGGLGLGVSILSYAGGVGVGIATDIGLVPDPEKIVANFEFEFEELRNWVSPKTP